MTAGRVVLRRAAVDDAAVLDRWDRDPDVIAATTDDPDADVAFDEPDWVAEIEAASDVSFHLIAEVDGRPIGAMQVIDPHLEPTHYWGDIEPGLRAVDIWIGDAADRNRGYGEQMMQIAHDLCFADPTVTAIVIDPLESNERARRFYRRLGYVDIGPHVFGDGDDCIVMRFERATWEASRAMS